MMELLVLVLPHSVLGEDEALTNFCQEDIMILQLPIHSSTLAVQAV